MNTFRGPDKDTFYTFRYRCGYVHTCQNRVTNREEVSYQIDEHYSDAKSVMAAKIAITKHMENNPYQFHYQSYNTNYTLVVPRARSLSHSESSILAYIVCSFSFLLSTRAAQKQVTIDANELASVIEANYHSSNPLPVYHNVMHNIIKNDIVDALHKDPTMFDGLDCFELLSDLAASRNVEDETVVEIYNTVASSIHACDGSRISVCISLLRSLGETR